MTNFETSDCRGGGIAYFRLCCIYIFESSKTRGESQLLQSRFSIYTCSNSQWGVISLKIIFGHKKNMNIFTSIYFE